jgi:hypothetical protein
MKASSRPKVLVRSAAALAFIVAKRITIDRIAIVILFILVLL